MAFHVLIYNVGVDADHSVHIHDSILLLNTHNRCEILDIHGLRNNIHTHCIHARKTKKIIVLERVLQEKQRANGEG